MNVEVLAAGVRRATKVHDGETQLSSVVIERAMSDEGAQSVASADEHDQLMKGMQRSDDGGNMLRRDGNVGSAEVMEVAWGPPIEVAPQKCAPCGLARMCGTIMVCIVLGLISLTWIPMVKVYGDGKLSHTLILLAFHILLFLLLASYFQTMFTDPGTVRKQWHREVAGTSQPAYPMCKKSNYFKPPRSHFDSVTQRLVLNMDHFCPWVNNTVGFYNKKFFILFLIYTVVTCAYAFFALAPILWSSSKSSSRSSRGDVVTNALMMVAVIFDGIFALTLTCFAVVHVYFAANNRTTIEHEPTWTSQFDLGAEKNLEYVFGRDRRLWLCPLYGNGPASDGHLWELDDGSWAGHPEAAVVRYGTGAIADNVMNV